MSDAIKDDRDYQKKNSAIVSYVLCMWGLNYSLSSWKLDGLSMKFWELSAYLLVILTLFVCWGEEKWKWKSLSPVQLFATP